MTSFQSFKSFITALISITVLVVLIASPWHTPVSAQTLSTRYQQNRANLAASLDTINQSLREKAASLSDITQQKNNLQAEISRRQDEIKVLDEQITQTRVLEAEKQAQIEENEKKRDELLTQMQEIIPLLQKQSRKSQIQIIGESMLSDNANIGEVGRVIFGLSSLQVQLDKLDQDLQDVNDQLAKDKEQLEEIRRAQENSRFLIQSQRDGLQLLLQQTQGQEALYQGLVNDLRTQRTQQEAQIKQLDAQEAERRRIEAEQARIAANNQNNGGGSTGGSGGGTRPPVFPGSCRFEDGRNLPVRLTRPAQGIITDTFGCPSASGWRAHDGYDIAAGLGTSIVAAYSGSVVRKGFQSGGFGHFVVLQHQAGGMTFFTLYAHLKGPSPIPQGSFVSQGQQIASMGCSGYTLPFPCGIHLHFMIISDSYLSTNDLGCTFGSSRCFNPGKFTNL